MLNRLMVLVVCLLGAQAVSAATILVYGDSLSAGYGLSRNESWVHLLEQRVRARNPDYTVTNASISGETTLGGANRIAETLRMHRPTIIILALGANDGLRGTSPESMRNNLERIIDTARRTKTRVVLVGMRVPPNYGRAYTEKFQAVYRDVARSRRVPLVPFLLEGFADKREYFQADNLHPAAVAQPVMLETVWKVLAPLIK